MLEMYEETPIFIPIDITEETVESVARKLFGELRHRRHGLGGTTGMASKIWGGQYKTTY